MAQTRWAFNVSLCRVSFRSGEAARNRLFACAGSEVVGKQILPFGRHDDQAATDLEQN